MDNQSTSEIGATGQTTGDIIEQGKTMARDFGERARSAASEAGTTAQDLAEKGREQVAVASDVLYQQGARAGEYLTRNVTEYPLSALLVAGVFGYAIAYLIHHR
ncbi:MAG TPA: hypothetical protein VKQ73_06350 [Stellaceae bacterium]|nr:hypothetical protein [Stellaceae bacterium]